MFSLLQTTNPRLIQIQQDKLQTFYGENFVYQFMVCDPKCSDIRFTLFSGPERANVSFAGLLMWKAESQTLQQLTLPISDDCNTETKAQMRYYL